MFCVERSRDGVAASGRKRMGSCFFQSLGNVCCDVTGISQIPYAPLPSAIPLLFSHPHHPPVPLLPAVRYNGFRVCSGHSDSGPFHLRHSSILLWYVSLTSLSTVPESHPRILQPCVPVSVSFSLCSSSYARSVRCCRSLGLDH